METIIKSREMGPAAHSRQTTSASASSFIKSMEFNRFGIIAMLVLVIGCTGGLAASFGAGDNIIQLALVAFPTIIALALILAVAPMRLILYVCGIALLLDLVVLIF